MSKIYIVLILIALAACSSRDNIKRGVETAVREQLKTYPESHLQDIYKNFFQDYFGPGHLISDTTAAANYLQEELAAYTQSAGPVTEATGWQGNFYRVNLSVLKEHKIPYPVFLAAFIKSANQTTAPTQEEWISEWGKILSIIDGMSLNLPDYEVEKIRINELLLSGKYALHHSRAYNSAYEPHYRLVAREIFDKELKEYLKGENN